MAQIIRTQRIRAMKDPMEVLRMKEQEVERVKQEIEKEDGAVAEFRPETPKLVEMP